MSVEELAVLGTAMDYGVYGTAAMGLVQYDDDSHMTIGGVPIEERMHIGVFEEWSEIFGGDSDSTELTYGYSRAHALQGGAAYVDTFRDDPFGEAQVTLHTKEFGDNLWYVTNYLALFGISLEDAMYDVDGSFVAHHDYDGNMLQRDEDLSTYPPELADFIVCGRALFSHMGSIFHRFDRSNVLDEYTTHALKQLARQYIESMAVLARSTFKVSLEEIMMANLQKISGRWENGTVLGYGDTR